MFYDIILLVLNKRDSILCETAKDLIISEQTGTSLDNSSSVNLTLELIMEGYLLMRF